MVKYALKIFKKNLQLMLDISWEEAKLKLASTARVSKVTLLTKDSFIFKIGSLHQDDLKRVEDMYKKFLKDNGAV
ncbi:hypothetical protein [Agathobacter rectalis]|uniref:Uncharacterized protein n=1 Tax=Agathobacter rectalis TaxID=39491 RepID=A0A3E5ALA2_9FIRM|nr:hypothetical protein [Agathobacter rectalis]MBO9144205.1 hypothetical protein [Escherichia coli]RGN16365.1 hypothetical protein DXB76_11015 [Agathobacter rectalis]RGN21542.1 hypothetical protein DXB72_12090 [Agathobacter rectalis]RGN21798.1 hypothetical protein DXB69_12200 [Agathobacter rectalis]